MSGDHPTLAVGLHWNVWGEDEGEFDLSDVRAVRDEFHRQVDAFHGLLGRLPTHVDSHRRAHREEHVMPVFQELVAPLGVPLRDDSCVRFVGRFYAQWECMVTNPEYVSMPFLQHLLHEEVGAGWTEFSCHPGYASPDYSAVYLSESEAEPRVRQTTEELDIRVVSMPTIWRRSDERRRPERGAQVSVGSISRGGGELSIADADRTDLNDGQSCLAGRQCGS